MADQTLAVEDLWTRYGGMVVRRCRRVLRHEDEPSTRARRSSFSSCAVATACGSSSRPPSSYQTAANLCLNGVGERRRPAADLDGPILAATLDPVIGVVTGSDVDYVSVEGGTRTDTAMIGHLGAGVDFHPGRTWSLGIAAGCNFLSDFDERVAGNDN